MTILKLDPTTASSNAFQKGSQAVVGNNVVECYVEMFRAFGRAYDKIIF